MAGPIAGIIKGVSTHAETEMFSHYMGNSRITEAFVVTQTTRTIYFDFDLSNNLLTKSTAQALYENILKKSGTDETNQQGYGIKRVEERWALDGEGDVKSLRKYMWQGICGRVEMREVRPNIWRIIVTEETQKFSRPGWTPVEPEE